MFLKSLFRKKRLELPDSWAVCHLGDERASFLRINTPLKDPVYQDGFAVSTVFAVPMRALGDETDLSFAFEDALFAELQDAGRGIVAAVMTTETTREFITYTPNAAVGAEVQASLTAKFPALTVTAENKEDAAWELFHSLLPRA